MSEHVPSEKTLEQEISDARQYYREKFIREIAHLKGEHPGEKIAIFIIREANGAMVTIYDLDKSETEPVYSSGMHLPDWQNLATSIPGHGLALPIMTFDNMMNRLIEGLTNAHNGHDPKDFLVSEGPDNQ